MALFVFALAGKVVFFSILMSAFKFISVPILFYLISFCLLIPVSGTKIVSIFASFSVLVSDSN